VKRLDVFARHPTDDSIFEACLAARHGESPSKHVTQHLADCAACAARYDELTGMLDMLRAEGELEADAIFTPERLRHQQQQIARRIEHAGRSARVITFPGRFVGRSNAAHASTTGPRWVAAAAAAGLFIGVALGASYPWGGGRHANRIDARFTPVATRGTEPGDVAADDAFLSELELALERPHTRELVAFDALTPHVREVRDNR
jgi:hypothetical protein